MLNELYGRTNRILLFLAEYGRDRYAAATFIWETFEIRRAGLATIFESYDKRQHDNVPAFSQLWLAK